MIIASQPHTATATSLLMNISVTEIKQKGVRSLLPLSFILSVSMMSTRTALYCVRSVSKGECTGPIIRNIAHTAQHTVLSLLTRNLKCDCNAAAQSGAVYKLATVGKEQSKA